MRSTEPVPLDKARLKQARLAAEMTGAEVARRAGVQRQNYYAIESGRRPVAFDTYLALVDTLDVDPADLVPDRAATTLQGLRLQRRFTKAGLAEQLGVSYDLIYAIENGHRNLTNHLASRLAAALDVSVTEIETRLARQLEPTGQPDTPEREMQPRLDPE